MYKYETHLHTFPVSRCGKASVEETLRFYHSAGYDGVFLTNHFLDGNINIDRSLPYEEKLRFYVSDYEEAVKLAPSIGIRVFFGVELSYGGTDFLIYGLDPEWYFAHPEIMEMDRRQELELMMAEGALVVQAHPFREASYIDHIRLFPRSVQGVEIYNAGRDDLANAMAVVYADAYELVPLAGSDNHRAGENEYLGGIMTDTPLLDIPDFIHRVLERRVTLFKADKQADGTWKEEIIREMVRKDPSDEKKE